MGGQNRTAPTLTVVDAPAGLGKTMLLQEIQRRVQKDWAGWRCIMVDGSVYQNRLSVLNAILTDAGHAPLSVYREGESEAFVIRTVGAKVFLLFDQLEQAEPQLSTWLRDTVRDYEGLCPPYDFRAVFAGRYIAAGRQRNHWPGFQQVPLQPFKENTVREVLDDMAPALNHPGEDRLTIWSRQILYLSGGHPGIILYLADKLVESKGIYDIGHPITHKSATCCNIIYFREVSMGWVQQELGALSCAMSVGKSV